MVCCPKCKKSFASNSSLNRHIKDKVCTKVPEDVACRAGDQQKDGYLKQKIVVDKLKFNLYNTRKRLREQKQQGASKAYIGDTKQRIVSLRESLKREEALLARYR